jgi:hypothetical protein
MIAHPWCSVLLVGIALFAISVARADSDSVARCILQVGEFGNDMVQICVADDVAAEKALSAYPEESKHIVTRCVRNVEQTGWVMAKRCADRDIAAAKALDDYPAEHEPLILKCTGQVGSRGPARVMECVDRAIAASQGPRQE